MNFLEELQKRTGKKVQIGKKIKCINPKHEDKEPSMHIYENHAYCFGCGFVFPPRNNQMIAESFQFLLNEYASNVDRFHKIQPFFYDEKNIFWIWDWERCCYRICDDLTLLSLIDRKLEFQGSTIRKNIKQEYLEAFKLIGRRNIPKEPQKTWIQFGDYVTNIKIGHNWGEKGRNADPTYFYTNPIPWKIGQSEETPVMDNLFKEWVGEDNVKTLYEIIAYCCVPDMPIHLCFCLIGSGRNGKSVFQRLLTKFLGQENCVSTELDLLIDNRFESFKLYKKLACQLGETNWGMIKKTSLFKKLVGGDLIGFEKKNKDPFDDYNYAKIIINSNSLPTTEDTSEGFYRRWLIIDFPNEFPEGKDILETIPEQEYNNLSRKVIKILPKLLEKGNFTNQGSIEERRKKYMIASNPIEFFIKNCCVIREDYWVKTTDLYQAYSTFLRQIKSRVVSRKEYNNALNECGYYAIKTSKCVNLQDERYDNGWFIDGLKVRDDFVTFVTSVTKFSIRSSI